MAFGRQWVMEHMAQFSWSDQRAAQMRVQVPALGRREWTGTMAAWRAAAEAKLWHLVRVPPGGDDVGLRVMAERAVDGGRDLRFVFAPEPGFEVPGHLLIPDAGARPLPVMICLQGHTTGMHVSLGRSADGRERVAFDGERDFAVQAMARGYAALTLELRGFGEVADTRDPARRSTLAYAATDENRTCRHAAMTALLIGRTLLGERVRDVMAACDVVAALPELDRSRIHVIGHSGGGTVGWYAAALEPRIKGLIAASCVCTIRDSIGAIDHCVDNYVPDLLRWFDFADIAGLIAPRPLLIVMGRDDPIFPRAGVEAAYGAVRDIYTTGGAADACALVFGDGGHRFYAEPAWRAFARLSGG